MVSDDNITNMNPGRFSSTLLLLTLILPLCLGTFASCKDRARPPRPELSPVDAAPYLGRYRLRPAYKALFLTLNADFTVRLEQENGPTQEGIFEIQKDVLHIYIVNPTTAGQGTAPTGNFLLSDYGDGHNWRGFWKSEIHILSRP